MDLYNASNVMDGEEEQVTLSYDEMVETRTNLQSIVDRAEMVKRLHSNPDFKAIVMDGYFSAEPQRLASLMASGRVNRKTIDDCSEDIIAIGKCRSFLQMMVDQGTQAANDIIELEAAYEEFKESETSA